MRDYHAINAVTVALAGFIQRAIGAVAGASVSTRRPDKEEADSPPRVNLFLYHVTPNSNLRNMDLPTRSADGRLEQAPRLALDLHYLMTFYGSERLPDLQPQVLLGLTLDALHSRPFLDTREIVSSMLDEADLPQEAVTAAHQVEQVILAAVPMELEQLSRLWSMAFQAPYALSVAYKASVAILTGAGISQQALPVIERHFEYFQLVQPRIDHVRIEGHGEQRALVVEGRRLLQNEVRVLLGPSVFEPPPSHRRMDRLVVPLSGSSVPPSPPLRPGVLDVRVLAGKYSESNSALVALPPEVSDIAVTQASLGSSEGSLFRGTIVMDVQPEVAGGQRRELVLNEYQPPSDRAPRSFRFGSLQRKRSGSLQLSFHGVPAGSYLVRLRIDGAESALQRRPRDTHDPSRPRFFDRPRVEIPPTTDSP